jgi:hypothetical protein
VSSLFRRVIGPRYESLPRELRAVHDGILPRSFSGTCRVERGAGWISRLCGSIAGLPAAADSVALRLRIDRHRDGERWQRDFGGVYMCSTLRDRQGQLEERLGPAVMRFALDAPGEAIEWRLTRVRVLGVPLPLSWFRGVRACEAHEGGRYRFDVRAELPIAGLLVHYRGTLDVGS